jgi:hypothetical protein
MRVSQPLLQRCEIECGDGWCGRPSRAGRRGRGGRRSSGASTRGRSSSTACDGSGLRFRGVAGSRDIAGAGARSRRVVGRRRRCGRGRFRFLRRSDRGLRGCLTLGSRRRMRALGCGSGRGRAGHGRRRRGLHLLCGLHLRRGRRLRGRCRLNNGYGRWGRSLMNATGQAGEDRASRNKPLSGHLLPPTIGTRVRCSHAPRRSMSPIVKVSRLVGARGCGWTTGS